MTARSRSSRGFCKLFVICLVAAAGIAVILAMYGPRIRQFVRESFMQQATSPHYEVLSPRSALSPEALKNFATQRENLFSALDKKLGGSVSNAEIRIVLDPDLRLPALDSRAVAEDGTNASYRVFGTAIRSRLSAGNPQIPPAADAEAVLYAAWGKPGNPQIARWTSQWLAGEAVGTDLGMAAAEVEQKLGHQTVEKVLTGQIEKTPAPNDRDLLGAAWIGEIAEFGGLSAVQKLYTAKLSQPTTAEVTKILGTTPLELDRKWQLYMYAYLAGMPTPSQNSSMPMNMPMNMPMSGSH